MHIFLILYTLYMSVTWVLGGYTTYSMLSQRCYQPDTHHFSCCCFKDPYHYMYHYDTSSNLNVIIKLYFITIITQYKAKML